MATVGATVAASTGEGVGTTGLGVGAIVGGSVGATGASVGGTNGASVGGSVGGSVGPGVGGAVGVAVGSAVGAVVGASSVQPQAAFVTLTLDSQTSAPTNPNLVDLAHSAQVMALVASMSVIGMEAEGFCMNCSPQGLQGLKGPGASTHPPQAAMADAEAAAQIVAGIRPPAAAFS